MALCSHLLCLKLYFLFAAKQFLIAGGWAIGNDDLATEVIDVSTNSDVTTSFGEIPSKRFSAVGGLLGSTPIICGGEFTSWNTEIVTFYDSCFTFEKSQWTETHQMTTKRANAASIQLNATTLWILGGLSGENLLDSTEFLSLGSSNGNPGPKLPYGLANFCAVKYAEDEVYVIGGWNGFDKNKVFIFNPMNGFAHIEGPSLKIKRRNPACGIMSNGLQSKIVVAGGYNGYFLNSVEIFDPTINNWIPGKK